MHRKIAKDFLNVFCTGTGARILIIITPIFAFVVGAKIDRAQFLKKLEAEMGWTKIIKKMLKIGDEEKEFEIEINDSDVADQIKDSKTNKEQGVDSNERGQLKDLLEKIESLAKNTNNLAEKLNAWEADSKAQKEAAAKAQAEAQKKDISSKIEAAIKEGKIPAGEKSDWEKGFAEKPEYYQGKYDALTTRKTKASETPKSEGSSGGASGQKGFSATELKVMAKNPKQWAENREAIFKAGADGLIQKSEK